MQKALIIKDKLHLHGKCVAFLTTLQRMHSGTYQKSSEKYKSAAVKHKINPAQSHRDQTESFRCL
jgi:hypothetical protein